MVFIELQTRALGVLRSVSICFVFGYGMRNLYKDDSLQLLVSADVPCPVFETACHGIDAEMLHNHGFPLEFLQMACQIAFGLQRVVHVVHSA